jgi:hypothetical protein
MGAFVSMESGRSRPRSAIRRRKAGPATTRSWRSPSDRGSVGRRRLLRCAVRFDLVSGGSIDATRRTYRSARRSSSTHRTGKENGLCRHLRGTDPRWSWSCRSVRLLRRARRWAGRHGPPPPPAMPLRSGTADKTSAARRGDAMSLHRRGPRLANTLTPSPSLERCRPRESSSSIYYILQPAPPELDRRIGWSHKDLEILQIIAFAT